MAITLSYSHFCYSSLTFMESVMKFFNMLMNDPIVIYSFGGLAILLGISAFYIYYFLKKITENTSLTLIFKDDESRKGILINQVI